MPHPATKLLYVDDDPGLCRLVQRGLERLGCSVDVATDGESGLRLLQQTPYDVVALDQNMPGLDGLGILARMRDLPSPPPVVFVTAEQDSRIAVAALKAGAADYVAKDVQGEFITLLKAAADSALEATLLRRAKEAAEAETRAARDQFAALAAERAVLLREVNHRVGNSLQIIAGMLRMQGTAAGNDDVKQALNDATNRVMAVAQVHRRLYTSDDVKSVALDQYLGAMIDDLRKSSDEAGANMLSLQAAAITLPPDHAVAVGVIVNELIINAMKYAYPPGSGGPIRIGLAIEDARAVLSVEDDGIGIAPDRAPSSGLGQRIVKAMADKLQAQIEHDPSFAGTRIRVLFDLPAATVANA